VISSSGELERRRRHRLREELREIVARRLEQKAREICTGDRWDGLTDDVIERSIDPWSAADEMLSGVDA
jgi:LAO/AO transport system kinase